MYLHACRHSHTSTQTHHTYCPVAMSHSAVRLTPPPPSQVVYRKDYRDQQGKYQASADTVEMRTAAQASRLASQAQYRQDLPEMSQAPSYHQPPPQSYSSPPPQPSYHGEENSLSYTHTHTHTHTHAHCQVGACYAAVVWGTSVVCSVPCLPGNCPVL